MADNKKKWGKFYWSDWLADEQLVQCSLAAQGLWMRMLCIAAKSDPVGYVSINGEPLDARGIARTVGGEIGEVESLLAELRKWGVYSVDRRGCIYNRRMIKEDKREIIARSNGARGGNPRLLGSGANRSKKTSISASDNQQDNASHNLIDKGRDNTQRLEARVQNPPNPLTAERGSAAAASPGEERDERKSTALSIITVFDDAIAEAWGPERRRAYPAGTDLQTALDWVDLGATPALCRQVFADVNRRFAENGKAPPGTLKARDRDIRQAVAAMAEVTPESDRHPDLVTSFGERVVPYALKHLPADQRRKLMDSASDPAMTDIARGRWAKQMLIEAGVDV